jgi:glutathione synthase
MTVTLGVVMDPIEQISFKKDTTLALLLAAQKRGWSLLYMEQSDLYIRDGEARARVRELSVDYNPECWHRFGESRDISLGSLDVILMRKDPPVDDGFIMATWILEMAEGDGAIVVASTSDATSGRSPHPARSLHRPWSMPAAQPLSE